MPLEVLLHDEFGIILTLWPTEELGTRLLMHGTDDMHRMRCYRKYHVMTLHYYLIVTGVVDPSEHASYRY